MSSPGCDGSPDAFVGMGRWHSDVDDRDVGAMLLHGVEQRVRIADAGDHVDSLAAQQQYEPFPEQRIVLGHHYPHGITAVTVVGPPAGLSTCNVPSCASTRPRIPASPEPSPTTAPPEPSSVTSTTSVLSCRCTCTSAR